MVIPLPSALADFSKVAQSSIQALSAIQEAVADPQAVVQRNITSVATEVATQSGELFQDAPTVMDSANGNFLSGITSPKSLDLGLQQAAAGDLFGTDLTVGLSVDGYLNANVSLGDVLPSQQIYALTQNLSITSLFADPLQAYTHVSASSLDIRNLCQEATAIITQIQLDLTNLLSVQLGINYAQFAQMGPAFFLAALEKISVAITKHGIICAQLQVRGRYDPASVADLCVALDEFANLVTFANTKIIEFDLLRRSVMAGFDRLRQIGRDLLAVIKGSLDFIPNYVKSTSFGKIFQAVQGKVCAKAANDLSLIKKDVQAFTSLNADDRAKVNAAYSMAASIHAIKAFICGMDPSGSVVDPIGPFARLKAAYDGFSADLSLYDPTGFLEAIEEEIASFSALMNAGVIRDNAVELAVGVASIGAAIAGLLGSVT